MRPVDPPFVRAVTVMLAGPVIGMAHFLALYLFAEVACSAGWLQGDVVGMSGVSLVSVVVTVLAVAAMLVAGRFAYRRRGERYGELASVGLVLTVVFIVVALFVGIPPAFLDPC